LITSNSISLNDSGEWNESGKAHYIGGSGALGNYGDFVFADFYHISGQQLDATAFGERNADGVWVPKAYTGSYGTNGCHLDFADAAVTSGSNAGLGKDVSGNGNYWNTTNISVTSGETYDALTDTPTNNYCTINSIFRASQTSESYYGSVAWGGMRHSYVDANDAWSIGTIGVATGKWYWEVEIIAGGSSSGYQNMIGCAKEGMTHASAVPGVAATEYMFNCYTTDKYNNSSASSYGDATAGANGDIFGIAMDCDNGAIYVRRNGGAWFNSGDPTSGSSKTGAMFTWTGGSKTMFPVSGPRGGSTPILHNNFGQQPFAASAPTGFKTLCTTNLPSVAITDPSLHFDLDTYTGTNTTHNRTGFGFQPSLAWIKKRSGAASHNLIDAVRGVRTHLQSDTTNAETTEASGYNLTAFNSDGYTLGTDNVGPGQVNASGGTYLAALWKAGGVPTTDNVAGAGNTPTAGSVKIDGANLGSTLAGTIAATRLSANTTAGFSIVAFNTGAAANITVAHGLSSAPAMIILKNRSTQEWNVWHKSLTNTQDRFLILNATNAEGTASRMWANTAPTSSVFSLESGYTIAASTNAIAYCFAEIPGYSKFGSYVGNGSADGPYIHCGFRPRFLMVKMTSGADSWQIHDTAREPYNMGTARLYANSSAAEDAFGTIDIVSNGFKPRGNDSAINSTGAAYIYIAFAEYPFGGSNVNPAPAR
jgi:hypothetical protein